MTCNFDTTYIFDTLYFDAIYIFDTLYLLYINIHI